MRLALVLQVFQPTMDQRGIMCALEADHPYPPTKIMWSPAVLSPGPEYLATTADYLRLWTVSDTAIEQKITIADVRRVACGSRKPGLTASLPYHREDRTRALP